ncbi:MAG: hypothetical protein IPM77_01330 [Crocinitomicaceae bacterium]|nr:hypothetical protein [Crocinitomicaceae bacterium]
MKKRETVMYEIQSDEDEKWIVNPVIRYVFAEEFKINLPEETAIDSLKELFQKEFKSILFTNEFNEENSWQLIQKEAVGIFNYKKASLYKDYQSILKSPGKSIEILLGEKNVPSDIVSKSKKILPVSDASQSEAINTALHYPAVIEGPPGTGKSETLVNLIEELLFQNKKILFVSEKKSALEVVYNRLKKNKLEWCIAYFEGEENEKRRFYSRLKKTWDLFSEPLPARTSTQLNFETGNLIDFYTEKLLKTDSKTKTSVQQLLEKLILSDFSEDDLIYSGTVPPYELWNETIHFLKNFELGIVPEFQADSISKCAFFSLNAAVFSEPDPVTKISTRIEQIEKAFDQIETVRNKYLLDCDFNQFIHLAIAGSMLAMVNKNQLDLLQPDHKKHKQFNSLTKKYQLVKNKLHQAELVNQRWIKKPTVAEITELADLLKQKKKNLSLSTGKKSKSILQILKRNSVKSHAWFSEFSPSLSVTAKLQMLEEIRTEWHLRGEMEDLKIKIRHDLNILNPDTEIDHILQIRNKLNTVNSNDYIRILSHENSIDLIQDLSAIHPVINRCMNLIHFLFASKLKENPAQIKSIIPLLKDELSTMEKFQFELELFFKTDVRILNFIHSNPFSLEQLDAMVTHTQLISETRFEPAFRTLSGDALKSQIKNFRQHIQTFRTERSEHIFSKHAAIFHTNLKLLSTPASRLKENQKKTKSQFKEARKKITHELNKKRQHLSVLELLKNHVSSVLDLHPLWMLNPLSAGHFLPCSKNLFDVVIFDEASQIPLEDALPSIYRGAQLIVVGDSKQMPPSDFFLSGSETKTLLDQATFKLKNVSLKNHYRSEHPALIQFSNAHFYDFELSALPPVKSDYPIECIDVNGVFEDQKNTKEAKSIALYYSDLLKQKTTDIAIIAFSKEQQLAIENEIQKLNLPENENLLLRNLENVQGIEKKIVLISIGYAKNKEGVFRKQFGPVNTENGINRLNVMFTRAVEKLVVFKSVSSADFGYSENPGAAALCDFIRFSETGKEHAGFYKETLTVFQNQILTVLQKNKIDFRLYSSESGVGITSFVQHSSNKILLADPCTSQNETHDFKAMMSGIMDRFKHVMIVLSADYLKNRKKTEENVVNFLR